MIHNRPVRPPLLVLSVNDGSHELSFPTCVEPAALVAELFHKHLFEVCILIQESRVAPQRVTESDLIAAIGIFRLIQVQVVSSFVTIPQSDKQPPASNASIDVPQLCKNGRNLLFMG